MFTIMIVDDNEQLQNEIGNLLIANRYSILKPTEFNKISQTVKDRSPDLILLEIYLIMMDLRYVQRYEVFQIYQ